MIDDKTITWIDSKKEPECAPNPAYPHGQDLRLDFHSGASCTVALPYPAKRCGAYVVRCTTCGLLIGVTTAGRPDDPKSVKFNCRLAARRA